MQESNVTLDKLCDLYRGEVSACETYRQALSYIEEDSLKGILQNFEQDHIRNMESIGQQIVALGGELPESSGAWGMWAKAVTGVTKLTGEKSTLKVLKEGEEHGLKEYNEVVNDTSVDFAVKDMVRGLIPLQSEHIAQLDRYMAS